MDRATGRKGIRKGSHAHQRVDEEIVVFSHLIFSHRRDQSSFPAPTTCEGVVSET